MKILARLVNGTEQVGEFKKVTRFGRFALAVANGSQRFNIWKEQSETLPNGEVVRKRSREILLPTSILSLTEINDQGEPVFHVDRGQYGTYTVPSPRPEGIPETVLDGVEYPQHRDEVSFRNFIYTRFPSGEGDEGEKWYVDGRGELAQVNSWNEPVDDEDNDILDDDDDDGGEPF